MDEETGERAQRREDQTEGKKEEKDKPPAGAPVPPCVSNSQRLSHCPSKSVIWNEDDLFWVPGLDVEDALEVVVKLFNLIE